MAKNDNPEQDINQCDTCSELRITFGESQIVQTQDSLTFQVGGKSITKCSHSH